MKPLFVTAYTAVTAAGTGRECFRDALVAARSALAPNDFEFARGVAGYIGRVPGVEASPVPPALAPFDCRNNRIAWLGLGQDGFAGAVHRARERYGPGRVAVIMGTSTSGILSTEIAYRHRDPATGTLGGALDYAGTHNFSSLAVFVRAALDLAGPLLAVSTACSSSAKVFAAAARWIETGVCDAAVVGGVDSLCGTTLYGFDSLQLVSRRACRPFDVDRDGLSLGEGAGFALLEREPHAASPLAFAGYGESADAHHMSSPHPEGRGAALAMRSALDRAGRSAVAYVSAHGTATRNNDAVEARAIAGCLGDAIPVTSVKGTVGHTLGAAGAIGAIGALLSLEHGFVPATANTDTIDPDCPVSVPLATLERPVEAVLVNALGFGGNNASLVFARAEG